MSTSNDNLYRIVDFDKSDYDYVAWENHKPIYFKKVEADQQDESQLAIIANNLYNIHGSNGHGVFDTDKCDEIASFILQDLKKEYTLTPKQ